MFSEWFLEEASAPSGGPNAYLRRQTRFALKTPKPVQLALTELQQLANPLFHGAERAADWVVEVAWNYRSRVELRTEPSTLEYRALGPHSLWLGNLCLADSLESNEPLRVEVPAGDANELTWRFEPLGPVARARRSEYFAAHDLPLDTPCFDERCFLIYPPYLWGWDWGPCLPLVGLCSLPEWVDSRVDWPEVVQSHTPDRVTLTLSESGDFDLLDPEGYLSPASSPGEWHITEPELWWPKGYGKPSLYRLRHRITGQERKIGLRTIEVDPYEFCFVVNGKRIWARGANWTPMTLDPTLNTPEALRKRVAMWADIQTNMLRVWGGQAGEADAFYEACDEHGILVWQDFLSSCHYLPDNPGWANRWGTEAQKLVDRVGWHACLALWCGNNEAQQMHEQRWAGTKTPDRLHGVTLYEQVFPSLPLSAPYVSTSPLDIHGSGHGDRHYWDVWHGQGDWEGADLSGTRFASEFGFASLAHPTADYDVPELLTHHNRTGKSIEAIRELIAAHYPTPTTDQDWVLLSQLNQRDALRWMIEALLVQEECHGALIWQANDCWPALSWSVIDWLGNPKPAFEELRRLFQPTVIAVHEGTWVMVQHDGGSCAVSIEDCDESGNVIRETQLIAESRVPIPVPLVPNSRCFAVGRPETMRWHLRLEQAPRSHD